MHEASAKILVVDNHSAVRNLICRYFSQKNYLLKPAEDKQTALEILRWFNPHIVILEAQLPDGSGYELCETIKSRTEIFVLMLTRLASATDKRKGFLKGTDDYLAKPFDLQELECRVKAILKRRYAATTSLKRSFVYGSLTIDPVHREIKIKNQLVLLTNKEFNLLCFLATQPGRVWRREELIENVWGQEETCKVNVVNVHMGQIRKKIAAVSSSMLDCIQTVRGIGYKFEVNGISNVVQSNSKTGVAD